jgi:hypothetical protein
LPNHQHELSVQWLAIDCRKISVPVEPNLSKHGLSMTMPVKAGKGFYLEKPKQLPCGGEPWLRKRFMIESR